tara:strand:- start:1139 stop:1354 length:216 start_codon:yes stop_codon:yes gene_type:complete
MDSLSVNDNIKMYEDARTKIHTQKKELDDELLRIEGSIRVLRQLKGLGLELLKTNNVTESPGKPTRAIYAP